MEGGFVSLECLNDCLKLGLCEFRGSSIETVTPDISQTWKKLREGSTLCVNAGAAINLE